MSDTLTDLVFGDGPITLDKVDKLLAAADSKRLALGMSIRYLTGIRARIIRDNIGPGHPQTRKVSPDAEFKDRPIYSLIGRLNGILGHSSYESPRVVVGGWHIFIDSGFLPSADNNHLLATLLGWKKGTDRYYAASVGNTAPGGVFAYAKDQDYPANIQDCQITYEYCFTHTDADILELINQAQVSLVAFIRDQEGLNE